MKEALNAMVQAVGDQAIALGTVADRLTALKQTLARQFPDMADELKSQIEADQDQSRTGNYDLQVSLAKLREAIAQLPDTAPARKAPSRAASPSPKRRKVL